MVCGCGAMITRDRIKIDMKDRAKVEHREQSKKKNENSKLDLLQTDAEELSISSIQFIMAGQNLPRFDLAFLALCLK